MNIVGVEDVTYGVEDLAPAIKFFTDFGLATVEKGTSGAIFETAEKTTITLRKATDTSLPPPIASGSTMREFTWGVAGASDIEAIGAELSRDMPVKTDKAGRLKTIDPTGHGIAFAKTRRVPVVGEGSELNWFGKARRVDTRFEFITEVRPLHIGHVVVYTPNYEAVRDFYVKRLGFRLSDTMRDRGVFLRAQGSSDHHCLFALKREQVKGVHHVSFAVTNFDELLIGGQHMEKQGWKTQVGPGRHVIGSNYFWYFHNPCGGAVEYYADMDYLTDAWTPREWEFRPDIVAKWVIGTAHQ
jgi:catechol 2,3-dioxygenase-like lactoylglutathione lyase family enzyme